HVVALGMSFWAIRFSRKPPSDEATFGHHKVEPLVALINAVTIFALSIWIFYEAYNRLLEPPTIKSTEMLITAIIGLLGNVAVVFILKGPKDLNIRSAYLHVIADTLSSFAVVGGGLVILYTNNYLIDPLLGFFIGGIILFSSIHLFRESLDILLERMPKHINLRKLKSRILEIEGVNDIHDVHIWSLCSHIHAMSAHVMVDDIHVGHTQEMIKEINVLLRKEFDISHCALQFESKHCSLDFES
ncbi:MAG: cation transporter, partial [Thermoplasmata archaeon]|nr:cation transporter [Thermoplasmata archaeon]